MSPTDAATGGAGREEHPTGWLVLTRYESIPYIIDALLDLPPRREFNQSELAEMADVSRQSVNRHLDLLLEIAIIEPVEGTSPQRYRFNAENEVSQALIQLDGAMNAAAPDKEDDVEDGAGVDQNSLEFDKPECDEGHSLTEMQFTEQHKLIGQRHWQYTCPECGRVVEISETRDGGLSESTLRKAGEEGSGDIPRRGKKEG